MRKAVLLTILMIISIAGTGTATTETSPTIDGDFSDWDSDEDVQTDAGKTLYFTWDSNYIYIGWDGTNWASDGDFFLYMDTGTGGSSTTKDWSGTHTLPFAADYGMVAGGGDYHQLVDYNDGSSQWENAGSNPSSSDVYWGWGSDDDTEIRISRSDIGSPTSMSIVVFAQWETAQNIWASFPNQNPASGSGSETLTHYFKVSSLTSGIAPDQIPVKENCAAGQYSTDNFDSCTPCPAGTFQPYTGKSWCTTAWGGQYATGTGNTGQSACAAGSYSPSSGGASACTPCEAGKFQADGAKSYCTIAEGGQYASGTGNTGTTDCVAGEYSSTSGGASACTPCAAGTYQPSAGKSWCSSALGGQYVSGTGATSQSPCAAGSYSPSSGGATSCTAVPADNYQDQAGMSWYTACPAGTSTSGATGSDEASDCA